jgi:flagellar biosynthesis protein FlhB
MSDTSAQDKTEQPTAKRLRESREKGQVPRSRELSTAVVMGAGALLLLTGGPVLARRSAEAMRQALSFSPELLDDPSRMPALLAQAFWQGLSGFFPLLVGTVLAALASPLLIGGWNFSNQALQPDFKRLDPIAGLGRLWSANSLVELVKSVAKFALVGLVAAVFVHGVRDELLALSLEPLPRGLGHGLQLLMQAFVWMVASLLLVAAIDAPYQLFAHLKRLRMSKQEIRDEHKQTEGRPEVKGRIRRLQQEMSQRRMMDKVPTADVVVTNPTHYAVALSYSADAMRAPRVVAKGAGEVARHIRELAGSHGVTLVSAPPLARALYRGCELDQEIPAPLYAAVAQVLSYVYQLRRWTGGPAPVAPSVGEVPGGEPDPET